MQTVLFVQSRLTVVNILLASTHWTIETTDADVCIIFTLSSRLQPCFRGGWSSAMSTSVTVPRVSSVTTLRCLHVEMQLASLLIGRWQAWSGENVLCMCCRHSDDQSSARNHPSSGTSIFLLSSPCDVGHLTKVGKCVADFRSYGG